MAAGHVGEVQILPSAGVAIARGRASGESTMLSRFLWTAIYVCSAGLSAQGWPTESRMARRLTDNFPYIFPSDAHRSPFTTWVVILIGQERVSAD